MLPLVYTSRWFGPLYLKSVLSISPVFRIKQEAVIKVSAGFRGSLGSGRWGKRGDFFLCADERCSTGSSGPWSPEFTQKNVQGLIRGKNHADSHQPAWLGWPPTKVSSTLPWGMITWSPHSFSSGLLRKGRQATGQLLVLVFGDVTPAQWERNREKPNFSWAFFTSEPSHGHQVVIT